MLKKHDKLKETQYPSMVYSPMVTITNIHIKVVSITNTLINFAHIGWMTVSVLQAEAIW